MDENEIRDRIEVLRREIAELETKLPRSKPDTVYFTWQAFDVNSLSVGWDKLIIKKSKKPAFKIID